MKKFGLKFNKQIKYNCDHDFFSRENEESFYVAGFIAADGCVKNHSSSKNSFQIQIGLSQRDQEHLEKIKYLLKSDAPIKNFLIKNSKRNIKWNDTWSSQINITSKQMFEDLKKFNIVPRKTLIYTFPEWMKNHPLKHHFIRGYNDGDGSFYISKLPDHKKVKQICFSMRGTPEFLLFIQSILEQECKLRKRDKPIRISSGHGCLEYGGNSVVSKITDYLYKNATIFLPRKREIAILAKNCI